MLSYLYARPRLMLLVGFLIGLLAGIDLGYDLSVVYR